MPKQSHTIFSVLRRGGVEPRPREGQSPSPTHFLNASVGADDPVRPPLENCHCEGAPRPWHSVISHIPRPLFPSPGPRPLQHGPGLGNMKGTTNSAKFFLESGTGKVCRPPPPRRLEMAIMLSLESMRHHGAWQQKITQPPKAAG